MAQNRFQAAGANDIPTLRRATNNAFGDLARQITTSGNSTSDRIATIETSVSTNETDISTLQNDVSSLQQAPSGTTKTFVATNDDLPTSPLFGDEMYVSVLIDDGAETDPVTLFTVGWYKYVDETIEWVSIS